MLGFLKLTIYILQFVLRFYAVGYVPGKQDGTLNFVIYCERNVMGVKPNVRTRDRWIGSQMKRFTCKCLLKQFHLPRTSCSFIGNKNFLSDEFLPRFFYKSLKSFIDSKKL